MKEAIIQELIWVKANIVKPEVLYSDEHTISTLIATSEIGDIIASHIYENDTYELRAELESGVQDPDNITYQVITKETYNLLTTD